MAKDADEVSAMMAAIEDFVRDSFESGTDAGMASARVGDVSLYVERGPLAFLAAAVRGIPPIELRAHMRAVIEKIHLSSYPQLRGYQGDSSGFEPCAGLIESCLQFRLQAPEKNRKPVFAYAFLLIVALVLGIFVGFRIMETMRWRRYVDGLRTHPGIVVTSADAGLHTYSISGLRDPLAADPARALGESRIDPARIKAIWHPYVSAAPELVLLRTRTRLEPPPTVVLTVSGETLLASGVAPTAWRSKAAAMAISVPGVEQFDARALEAVELQDLRRQAGELQSMQLLFSVGSLWIRSDQNRAVSEIAVHIRRIVQLGDAAGNSVLIRITGHTAKGHASGLRRCTASSSSAPEPSRWRVDQAAARQCASGFRAPRRMRSRQTRRCNL